MIFSLMFFLYIFNFLFPVNIHFFQFYFILLLYYFFLIKFIIVSNVFSYSKNRLQILIIIDSLDRRQLLFYFIDFVFSNYFDGPAGYLKTEYNVD